MLVMPARRVEAQSVSSIQPRSCQPGQTTKLVVQGKAFDDSLRFLTSSRDIQTRVQSIEPTKAVIELTLPADTLLGPFGLSVAGRDGPIMQTTLWADDLQVVQDNGKNHSQQTAQAIALLCSVEGRSEAGKSDFYKISVAQDQRVAFEILTQPLQSAMDPVLRLLDRDGETLQLEDEGAVGPDPRFSHHFAAAGDYWIEVHDNRHTAGGVYQLRVGDFPIVSHAYPLVLEAGKPVATEVIDGVGEPLPMSGVSRPADVSEHVSVSAKFAAGKSSAWVPVALSPYPQTSEEQATQPLTAPIGVSGRLTQAGEVDSYHLRGNKDQRVRITSRTRSLGCPTLLKMQLFEASGA
ncbi:MAG: hypothetical protein ACF788_06425, partial [Novipirellula sp. JB048]